MNQNEILNACFVWILKLLGFFCALRLDLELFENSLPKRNSRLLCFHIRRIKHVCVRFLVVPSRLNESRNVGYDWQKHIPKNDFATFIARGGKVHKLGTTAPESFSPVTSRDLTRLGQGFALFCSCASAWNCYKLGKIV